MIKRLMQKLGYRKVIPDAVLVAETCRHIEELEKKMELLRRPPTDGEIRERLS